MINKNLDDEIKNLKKDRIEIEGKKSPSIKKSKSEIELERKFLAEVELETEQLLRANRNEFNEVNKASRIRAEQEKEAKTLAANKLKEQKIAEAKETNRNYVINQIKKELDNDKKLIADFNTKLSDFRKLKELLFITKELKKRNIKPVINNEQIKFLSLREKYLILFIHCQLYDKIKFFEVEFKRKYFKDLFIEDLKINEIEEIIGVYIFNLYHSFKEDNSQNQQDKEQEFNALFTELKKKYKEEIEEERKRIEKNIERNKEAFNDFLKFDSKQKRLECEELFENKKIFHTIETSQEEKESKTFWNKIKKIFKKSL